MTAANAAEFRRIRHRAEGRRHLVAEAENAIARQMILWLPEDNPNWDEALPMLSAMLLRRLRRIEPETKAQDVVWYVEPPV